jgi:hypothetical protein
MQLVKFFICLCLFTSPSLFGQTIGQQREGDSASGVYSVPGLIGKTSTTGNLSYLKVDETGGLVTTALTGFGADFAFGDVTLAAIAQAVVRRTVYTEQTVNGTRSISSANANDTSAGTGARTLQIKYLDQTGAGPFTTTVTTNGTTCVATSVSNIAYVEQIDVLTVGSTGSNVGIISLFVNSTCGGGTIGTMAATNNQTFWAHHYIPVGKEANITGVSVSHNGTTVGSGGVFVVRALPLTVTNQAERQVSDFIRLYGQSSTFARVYTSPVKVPGPARLILYVTPETASSTVYRGAIDFFEP